MANKKEDFCNGDLEFNAKLFQELRIKMGLTQKELANRFKLNLQTVIKWENGYSKPRLFDMYRLSKFYNRPIEDFVIDKGE